MATFLSTTVRPDCWRPALCPTGKARVLTAAAALLSASLATAGYADVHKAPRAENPFRESSEPVLTNPVASNFESKVAKFEPALEAAPFISRASEAPVTVSAERAKAAVANPFREAEAQAVAGELVNPAAAISATEPETDPRYSPENAMVEAADVNSDYTAEDLQTLDAAGVSPAIMMQTPEEIAAAPEENVLRGYVPINQVTVYTAIPSGGPIPGEPGSEVQGPAGPRPAPIPGFEDARLYDAWPELNFQWAATAMRHKPLYFEEVNLERYGYTVCPALQPLISGAHFFAVIPALPYKMTTHPPCECIYTLGYYRAGSCAPRRWHHEPLSLKAAAVEAGVAVGLVFLIP